MWFLFEGQWSYGPTLLPVSRYASLKCTEIVATMQNCRFMVSNRNLGFTMLRQMAGLKAIHQIAEIINALFCHFQLSIKLEEASEWHKNDYFIYSYSLSSIKIEIIPFLPNFPSFNLEIRGTFCLVTLYKYYAYGLPFQ